MHLGRLPATRLTERIPFPVLARIRLASKSVEALPSRFERQRRQHASASWSWSPRLAPPSGSSSQVSTLH